jgi:hypothetical protein
MASIGTQTAAVSASGFSPPGVNLNTTEKYDGSAWTASGNVNTARRSATGSGIQTTGVMFGGFTTTQVTTTEEYNGSTWASGNNMNTARSGAVSGGGQSETDTFAAGGNAGPARTNATEFYDGTSWTTQSATLATARDSTATGGGQSGAYVAGGFSPSVTGNTEEYSRSSSIITGAAWASGGAIGTALQDPTGFGLQTAAVIFGGETAPGAFVTTTQNYDGSTWTASGAYPISVTKSAAAGTQTSGLGIAGGNPYGVTTVSEYGGSTWTAGGAYPVSVAALGGVGTQTAALGIAGDVFPTSPRYSTAVRSYDGSAWTTAPSLAGAGRYANLTTGSQTAAMTAGGSSPGGSKATEVYNGVSWTSSGNLLNDRSSGGASRNGAYTNSLVFGTNGALAVTESFDGSIWSTAPNMATARYGAAGAGTGTLALAAGGRAPGFSTATEEFTGETTSANVKTITTS